MRLAALHLVENPSRALGYLSEAIQIDPKNPDLYTYKASLSEALNKNQIALSDYITAVKYDRENPFRREQLADFYLRTHQYPQALEILKDTLNAPSSDSIWLKTIFWSLVAVPLKEDLSNQDIPLGAEAPFIAYLLNLPSGVYWDQQAFEQLTHHEKYSETLQETFWMQLIGALKEERDEEALHLLDHHLFQHVSWAPDLEKSLKAILHYRLLNQSNAPKPLSSIFPNEESVQNPLQLLTFLSKLSDTTPQHFPAAIPHQLQGLLLDKEAIAIVFLGMGWTEAALQLHALEKLPETFPDWVAIAMTKAIAQNRSDKTALFFALAQKQTPALTLLVAELALRVNEKQIAFNSLKGIYTVNDENGEKAALLIAQFLVEYNNFTDAKKALMAQPSLVDNIKAREILARVALHEKNTGKATELYEGLEKESLEAKSFLARKAFEDKNWTKAHQLTLELLKENPQNPTLVDNLQRIIAEEKRHKSHS